MKKLIFIFIAIAIMLLPSCSVRFAPSTSETENSIIGTWEYVYRSSSGGYNFKVTAKVTYDEDGTFTNINYGGSDNVLGISKGSWEVEDNLLTEHYESREEPDYYTYEIVNDGSNYILVKTSTESESDVYWYKVK